MKNFFDLYDELNQEQFFKLFEDVEVEVVEKLDGSNFSFEYDNNYNLIFYKGKNKIDIIDRTLISYYEQPINFIESQHVELYKRVTPNMRFCFQYFGSTSPHMIKYDRLPANNLILTHLHHTTPAGKVINTIDLPITLKYLSSILRVACLLPQYTGTISKDILSKILELRNSDLLMHDVFRLLNVNERPLCTNTTSPIEDIIFKLKFKASPQILVNLGKKKHDISKRLNDDINELVILDFLEFIQRKDILSFNNKGTTHSERYLNLIGALFISYVTEHESKIKNITIPQASFSEDAAFRLNYKFLSDELISTITSSTDRRYELLFKIILGSFRKSRNLNKASYLMNAKRIEEFNNIVHIIHEINK